MGDIDFVVTWVDGNDPAWLAEKDKYTEGTTLEGDTRASRYREWGFFRYWFRCIDQNAPWVNKIHLVTWGHLPDWLDATNPKLHVVTHKDFIPERFLPTFSCRPIEFNLHRIEGLSDRFVYFNDDMFLLQPVKPDDFFVHGLPCDVGIMDATIVNGETVDGEKVSPGALYLSQITNLMALNRNFDKKTSLKKNPGKWFSPVYGALQLKTVLLLPWKRFTGFHSIHAPYSYLKSTYEDVWSKEPELVEAACMHKSRVAQDVSSRLLSIWQLANGSFYPRSPKTGFKYNISAQEERNELICREIRNKKYKMICLNDDYHGDSYEQVRTQFLQVFQTLFPEKSSYEK